MVQSVPQSVARLSRGDFGKLIEPRMTIKGITPRAVTLIDQVRGLERHCVNLMNLNGDGTCN